MGVAEAAIAAARQDDFLADLGHVGNQRLAVVFQNLGADRDLEHGVLAAGAAPVLAHAMAAARGLEMLVVAKIDQGIEAIDAFDDDIAAAPAVTAVRAAEFDEFLAPERDAAGAAIAGADIDLGFVQELHRAKSRARAFARRLLLRRNGRFSPDML